MCIAFTGYLRSVNATSYLTEAAILIFVFKLIELFDSQFTVEASTIPGVNTLAISVVLRAA